jgi:hypothetical protein
MDNSPPLGLVTISSTVPFTVSYADFGKKSLIKVNNVVWKFLIGINGIMVKRKIREGNIARKKLKEIADALDVMYPS